MSEAQALFQAGAAAYTRGEFKAAARAFEAAHEKAPAGPTLLNAARAWDAAKDRARAANDYAACLRIGGLSAEEQKQAEARMDELRVQLGVLEIPATAGIVATVAHAKRVALPAKIYLEPGQHRITLFGVGAERSEHDVTLSAGKTTRLEPPAKPRAEPPKSPPPRPAPTARTGNTLGWVSLGVGIAAAGATTYLGLSALDARDDYVASGRRDVDAYERARDLRTATNVALGASIVAGGLGVYLLVFHAGPEEPERTSASCAAWVGRAGGVSCRAAW